MHVYFVEVLEMSCYVYSTTIFPVDEGVSVSCSQARVWPPLSSHLLQRLGLEEEVGREPQSRKYSEAHEAVITARDRELEVRV